MNGTEGNPFLLLQPLLDAHNGTNLFANGAAHWNVAPDAKACIYRQIERQVVVDVPFIFLVEFNTEILLQPWVKGFRPSGLWPSARLENCWIER